MYSLKVLELTGLVVTEAKSVDEDKTFQDHIPKQLVKCSLVPKLSGQFPSLADSIYIPHP